MAALRVSVMILSVMLAILHYSQAQFHTKTLLLESTSHNNNNNNNNNNPISEELPVFEKGKYQVTNPINVMVNISSKHKNSSQPLLLVSPKEAGFYPVLFFIHGTMISNKDYSCLFQHIASHGYIAVAPQLFTSISSFDQTPEIKMAASVLEWLPSHLQEVLHEHVHAEVKANIKKLAISGHSRGGKSAFALALGIPKSIKLSTKISALIGVDPVAGLSKFLRTKPHVLTLKKNSLNLSIPVTVIGTGLGSHGVWPPCAPPGVSHQEFYNECKEGSTTSHFVIEKYGHMQMLNDRLVDLIPKIMSVYCAHGNGLKSTMRRTLGGIMVAFLDAYLGHDKGQYVALLNNKSLVPTSVSVDKKGDFGFAPAYAQV